MACGVSSCQQSVGLQDRLLQLTLMRYTRTGKGTRREAEGIKCSSSASSASS
eukprot:m.49148 g.49148  ORF g.49148 m.49148 type:complete len:52 (-) comp12453_c0_seq1:96-251(-)